MSDANPTPCWRANAQISCALWFLASVYGCTDDAVDVDLDLEATGAFVVTGDVASFDPPSGDTSPLSGQLWLPADDSGAVATRVPLVAFMPAAATDWSSYELLLEHIVSHGYAVVALDTVDQGRDPTRQASRLFALIEQTLAANPDAIDGDRIALVGHSYGGKLALLAATLDRPMRAQIRTVIAWDPVDIGTPGDSRALSVAPELMGEVQVPTLISGTPTSDCVVAGQNHDDFFAAAVSPSLHMFFPTADHSDWGDDFGEGVVGFGIASQLCRRVGDLNGAVLHRVTRRSNVAWLRKHLDGDRGMDRYLTGEAVEEIASGVVVVTEK